MKNNRILANYAYYRIGKKSGAVASFHLKQYKFHGVSGFTTCHCPEIIKEIKAIPLNIRKDAPWFGYCAEIDCFNKAFKRITPRPVSLKGGKVWASNIGCKNGQSHGAPKRACAACQYISRKLGVKYR